MKYYFNGVTLIIVVIMRLSEISKWLHAMTASAMISSNTLCGLLPSPWRLSFCFGLFLSTVTQNLWLNFGEFLKEYCHRGSRLGGLVTAVLAQM